LFNQLSLCFRIRSLTASNCYVAHVDRATTVRDVVIKTDTAASVPSKLTLTIIAIINLQVTQTWNRITNAPVTNRHLEVGVVHFLFLLLELDAVRRGTRIELALNGTTASLALRDLKEGQLQGPPGITLQRLVDPVSAAAAREVEFSYAEDAVPPGTVYQLHVRQIDGNEAWSAPLRVGGWPPR